jgi:hypothetical protein
VIGRLAPAAAALLLSFAASAVAQPSEPAPLYQYRAGVPDPVFFHQGIEVTLQQIGGARKNVVLDLQRAGAPLVPVTIDPGSRTNFQQLLTRQPQVPLSDSSLPDGHTNFYRSDDVAAVAYFYLDRPANTLPAIAPAAERLAALRPKPAAPAPN